MIRVSEQAESKATASRSTGRARVFTKTHGFTHMRTHTPETKQGHNAQHISAFSLSHSPSPITSLCFLFPPRKHNRLFFFLILSPS